MARIALLVSGLPRQWNHCADSQLALFQEHQADVFFHFWDTIEEDEKQRLLEKYQPAAYRFEKQIDFVPYERDIALRDKINSPSRMLSMYYSWQAAADVFRAYCDTHQVQYDLVVRLRADLMFFDSLDQFVPRLQPTDLLLSTYNDFGIINDMFALGGVEPILYYHSLFDYALAYKDRVLFNPERLLTHHLMFNKIGLRLVTINVVMLVFRPHMVGMPIAECLQQHPGKSKWKDQEIVESHMDYHGRVNGDAGIQHVERFRNDQIQRLEQERRSPPLQD